MRAASTRSVLSAIAAAADPPAAEGDGAAISVEKSIELTGVNDAEVLLFDLA